MFERRDLLPVVLPAGHSCLSSDFGALLVPIIIDKIDMKYLYFSKMAGQIVEKRRALSAQTLTDLKNKWRTSLACSGAGSLVSRDRNRIVSAIQASSPPLPQGDTSIGK